MSAVPSQGDRSAGYGVGIGAFAAVAFGFGTTFTRLAYDGGANPPTVVILRLTAFVVVMGLLLALLGRIRPLRRKPLVATLWMAVTLSMVSLGYQGSVAFIPVGLAALIFYTFPLLVGLIAVAAQRDRMTARKAIALLTGFVGLAMTLGPSSAQLDWRGITLALVATLGMALTITFGGGAMRDEDPLLMSVYTNVWMLVALAALTAITGSYALPLTGTGTLGAAGLCLSYVVAYGAWYTALGLVRPVKLAALLNIEPLVTLFAAWLVLGERLSPVQLVGAALVIASITAIAVVGRPELDRAAL